VVIPSAAVRREGDLTGVLVRGAAGDELRWVRLGATAGDRTEVLGGLRAGDRVVVPGDVTDRSRGS
jgi:multidrug efflux pump subunit AcrA (membrane-fusion protein)